MGAAHLSLEGESHLSCPSRHAAAAACRKGHFCCLASLSHGAFIPPQLPPELPQPFIAQAAAQPSRWVAALPCPPTCLGAAAGSGEWVWVCRPVAAMAMARVREIGMVMVLLMVMEMVMVMETVMARAGSGPRQEVRAAAARKAVAAVVAAAALVIEVRGWDAGWGLVAVEKVVVERQLAIAEVVATGEAVEAWVMAVWVLGMVKVALGKAVEASATGRVGSGRVAAKEVRVKVEAKVKAKGVMHGAGVAVTGDAVTGDAMQTLQVAGLSVVRQPVLMKTRVVAMPDARARVTRA